MSFLFVALVIFAYLIGSLSSAIIVTRAFLNKDIRTLGSKNPGATNVMRVAGKKAAVVVFVFDALKGAIPVYTCYYLSFEPIHLSIVAISACLGHIYPIFFGFKGGKGVATALGAMMPLNWAFTLCLLGTWMATFLFFRISSLAAIISLVLAPFYAYMFKPEYTTAVALLSLIILIKHRSNMLRLFSKTEQSFKSNSKKI